MSALRSECEGVVPAPPDAVYAVVADVSRRPRWLRELRNVDGEGTVAVPGLRFEAQSVVFGHTFSGVSLVERAECPQVLAERVHVGACFTSEWVFEATEDGATKVCHTMVVDLPGGPLRWLERLVLRRRVRVLQRAALAALADEVRRP